MINIRSPVLGLTVVQLVYTYGHLADLLKVKFHRRDEVFHQVASSTASTPSTEMPSGPWSSSVCGILRNERRNPCSNPFDIGGLDTVDVDWLYASDLCAAMCSWHL
jgi:hypothetical protein